MKKIFSPLAIVFFLIVFTLTANAQTVDTRQRAFNYLTGEETLIYSFDLQKIREWSDAKKLAKIPEWKKLCKHQKFGTLFKSFTKGDDKSGVDFNATLVIAGTKSKTQIIVPICNTSNAINFFDLSSAVATNEFDQERGTVYATCLDGIQQTGFNNEVIVFQEIVSEDLFLYGDISDSMRSALIQQLASEMMYALHNHDKILADHPALKEHLAHLTGLDIWRNMEINQIGFNFDFNHIDFNNIRFGLWPTSSLHATIDEKGLHSIDTYLGDPEEVAEFIKPRDALTGHIDAEMIARIPASIKSIQFTNMTGRKSVQNQTDTLQFESQQRLEELMQRHPWVIGNDFFPKHIAISRYDDLTEADQIITTFANELQDIIDSRRDSLFRIEIECFKDTLDGGIHHLIRYTFKHLYPLWQVYDISDEEFVDENTDVDTDTITEAGEYVFDTVTSGIYERHWLLKDGFMMETNDGTTLQELLQKPEDSPIKQRALAHIDAPYYLISNQLASEVKEDFNINSDTNFLDILEGVVQGNVFTVNWEMNTNGENALAYILKILMKDLAK